MDSYGLPVSINMSVRAAIIQACFSVKLWKNRETLSGLNRVRASPVD